jgi:hypothetical protein
MPQIRSHIGGEVQRVNPGHPRRMLVGEPQQHGRADPQRERGSKRPIEHRVDVVADQAHRVDHPAHGRPPQLPMGQRPGHLDALLDEFVSRADHRGPIALADVQVTAGTGHDLTGRVGVLAVNHRDRRQIAVDLAQRAVVWCVRAGDDEVDTCHRNRVRGAGQAGLHHR